MNDERCNMQSDANHAAIETPPTNSHMGTATLSPNPGKPSLNKSSAYSALHMTQTCNVEWAEQVSTGTPHWNSAFASPVVKGVEPVEKSKTSNQNSLGLLTQPLRFSCSSQDKSVTKAEKADLEEELNALYSVFPNHVSPQDDIMEADFSNRGNAHSLKNQELTVGARRRRRKKGQALIWKNATLRNKKSYTSRKRMKRLGKQCLEEEGFKVLLGSASIGEERMTHDYQQDENNRKVCFQDLVHEMDEGKYKIRECFQENEARKRVSTTIVTDKLLASDTKLLEGVQHIPLEGDCDPFSEIEFNDEMIASLDAAVNNSFNDKKQSSQTDPSEYFLERAGTVPTSNKKIDAANRANYQSNTVFAYEDKHGEEDMTFHKLNEEESGTKDSNVQICEDQTHTHDDDDFGECPLIDFDEMDRLVAQSQVSNLDEMQTLRRKSQSGPACISFTRYCVVSVSADTESNVKVLDVVVWTHQDKNETAVQLEDGTSSLTTSVVDGQIYLHDEWINSCVEVGDIVHICSISGRYRTDNTLSPIHLNSSGSDDLVMVLHPDLLITPTTISDAIICPRRAVLKMRMGSNRMNGKSSFQVISIRVSLCLLQVLNFLISFNS